MRARGAGATVSVRTIAYGPDGSQVGDLHVPAAARPAVVCLLHGGWWRMPYGRDELDAVARDFAAWNVEYRRLGAPAGGWPGTFDDVADAIDHLATLADEGVALDLERVIVAGHSAGGHLALWSAARGRAHDELHWPGRVRPLAAAGLAAITDLAGAFAANAGNGAAGELLGGSPGARPDRLAAASPLELLPLGVPQLVVHGAADEALPVAGARDYVRAARAAGDRVEYAELPGAGHMDFLDPASEAHAVLCRWLERVAGAPGGTG